jgi:hypothetical protein
MADEESASLLGAGGALPPQVQPPPLRESRGRFFVQAASVAAAFVVGAVMVRQPAFMRGSPAALDTSSYKAFASGLDQDGWYLYKVFPLPHTRLGEEGALKGVGGVVFGSRWRHVSD